MNDRADYYVIFGEAPREAGRPGAAMARRVRGAIASAAGNPRAVFLVTGGIVTFPPSEASRMAEMLRDNGVEPGRIVRDERSLSTLDSVLNCARIIRADPRAGAVTVCSDRYHLLRCRVLFGLLGLPTRAGAVESGLRASGPLLWSWYCLREVPALVCHALLLFPAVLWRAAFA